MKTPSTPVSEVTKQSVSSSKATLPSSKGIKQKWRTYVGFDFWAEGNDLVDHLGRSSTPSGESDC